MGFYENLPEETKLFLNKAMDIYASIMDKTIECFSNLDKRILSLLAASFFDEGELKKIISKFEDLKLENVLEFMEMTQNEIKSLDGDYKSFYDENFKNDLEAMDLMNLEKKDYNRTPAVIISYFNHILVNGSGILNSFADYCDFSSPLFKEHPVFEKIEEYIKTNYSKDIVDEDRWRSLYQTLDTSRESISRMINPALKFDIRPTYHGFSPRFKNETEEALIKDDDKNIIDEVEQKRLDELAYWESDDIWEILDEVMAKFIGQEQFVEDIFYNIVNNQRMILTGNIQDGERSIIFVDGPTGTGKTAIIREITDRLNLPFHRSSITSYSPTGYKGGDIKSTLEHLLMQSEKDLTKAERGIVVFDEFDKLIYNEASGNGLESKKGVQQELLDFMGGGTYKTTIAQSIFGSVMSDFDTSKLTFICLGALTDLREKKTIPDKSIGFNSNFDETKKDSYEISSKDLIDLGYERELVGRFNTYLHTEEYSKDDLLRILKESTISPMKSFIEWINSYNKELVIEDGVYEAIGDAAYELNFGVRSLQKVMNDIRTVFLKQVMRSKDATIYLDVETVNRACKRTVTRKSRR